MSMNKETQRASMARKKSSRKPPPDGGKPPIDIENDDLKHLPFLLQKHCEARLYFSLPKIHNYLIREDGVTIPVEHPLSTGKAEDDPQLTITLFYTSDVKLKNIICQSSKEIDTRLFHALNHTLSYFPTLSSLKLDYCNITSEHILILQKTLLLKNTVSMLSLTGNPVKEQNFYHLINCGLKMLILKFCGINATGLRKMASEVFTHSSTLIHLDLSSNMVFDEGCKHISSILKCDRTLQSLNLTDCKIGDEGFKELMSGLLRFSLDDQQIALRRKIRFQYFKGLTKASVTEGGFNRGRGESVNVSVCTSDQSDGFPIIEEMTRTHPFIADSVQENGEIFCKGNYSLESLNLAYNHLTKASLDLLLKTLMEQNVAFGTDKGLQRVILEGNASRCPESEDATHTIQDLLASKKMRSKSSSSSLKSRPTLKRRKSSANSSEVSGWSNKERDSTAVA